MSEIWTYWCWPIAASRAWLDFWFAPVAVVAPAAHPAVPDELPCTDHDLFA
ncbi:MAG: hypothetical protein Q7J32_10715 [Sphingomonadaceae bacterium]|nr:hypothetical protein [Sphingomonadaceae bacterium]